MFVFVSTKTKFNDNTQSCKHLNKENNIRSFGQMEIFRIDISHATNWSKTWLYMPKKKIIPIHWGTPFTDAPHSLTV